jgi:hypothetical protein
VARQVVSIVVEELVHRVYASWVASSSKITSKHSHMLVPTSQLRKKKRSVLARSFLFHLSHFLPPTSSALPLPAPHACNTPHSHDQRTTHYNSRSGTHTIPETLYPSNYASTTFGASRCTQLPGRRTSQPGRRTSTTTAWQARVPQVPQVQERYA